MSTEVEIAWAAGLFEGEGSAGFYFSAESNRYGYPSLVISMTDKDVVDKFHRIVGAGSVWYLGLRGAPEHHKPQWRWSSRAERDVRRIITMFLPHMCGRRTERLLEVLANLDAKELKFKEEADRKRADRQSRAFEAVNRL
jgi:hypothetical protein